MLDEGPSLPDGTVVEVSPTAIENRPRFGNPAFGMWADRTEMPDSAKASISLRRSMERRVSDG